MKTKLESLQFEQEWLESFGQPELTGSWIIYGHPGNGKTRFALQLAKYMTRFGKVAYNSLEEGVSISLRKAIIETGIGEVQQRFILLDKESIADLRLRLSKRRSPSIIIIDSIQYTGLTYAAYQALRDEFRHKLFILISHADGKLPEGRVAKSIRFDAFIKIWVEGYVAYPVSRYGGNKPFIIWEQGAADCGYYLQQG